MTEIYVSEVMTENVISCASDVSLNEVVQILSSKRLSSLIITENNTPIAIIT
ncbi:MAG TPA: CBS domain-containing protein [Thiotrichaceae bacterium]|jgi:predicted transcriptional regulator|nr:CBS domain-containing protein [Thiotrichaceae bacterium]HIM07022.1 CBS domain-containing protein [Gammaproteobacteria bacterium]